jgi:salicylate hydroxylase
MASHEILIAGAGIGGLTVALALAREGFSVTILEQRTKLEEVGAGIQISPNASHVLWRLGLSHPLTRASAEPERLVVCRGETGRGLARMELGETMRRRYGAPYLVIHRADLQSVLLDSVRALPSIRLAFGRLVTSVENQPDGVVVTCDLSGQPERHEGAVLIGADGLWSRVAPALGDHSEADFCGYVAWRGTVPAADAPGAFATRETGLWLGRKAHVVHYPLRGGKLVNVVAVVEDETAEPGWSRPGEATRCRKLFRDWAPGLRHLLEAVPEWQLWSLFDRAPRRRWGIGRTTLLGDAAHPMLPFLAQGGAMAIEDAAILTRRLATAPDAPERALRAYEADRMARTARVQQAARRNGRIYHMAGLPAIARDMAIEHLGGSGLLDRYDWLYRWQPEREAPPPGVPVPASS